MIPSLRQLHTRWQNRKFARHLASRCQGGLLILLSTRRNFEIVAQLARLQPLWISNGPVVAEELGRLNPDYLKSTSEIVRLSAGASCLPRTVISFPDQLVGDGPSFAEVEFAGAQRHMSLFELLLVKRQQPKVFTIAHSASATALREIDCSIAPGTSLQGTLMHLLKELEAELRQPPSDWLAQGIFQRKSGAAVAARFRDEVQDIEALLRLLIGNDHAATPTIRQILERIGKLALTKPELQAG